MCTENLCETTSIGFIRSVYLFCCLAAVAVSGLAQTQNYGKLIVDCNGNSGCSPSLPFTTTAILYDASQQPKSSSNPTDICYQINKAIQLAANAGQSPAIIDARAFTGIEPCATDPFQYTGTGKATNISLKLLLGNVFIVTSVPWYTPQNSHSIEGISPGTPGVPSAGAIGTTIAACGPGLGSTLWNGTDCFSSTKYPEFPGGSTPPSTLPLFDTSHGPFTCSSYPCTQPYACIICGGGLGDFSSFPTGEGSGWNSDADGEQISNIRLDLGQVNFVFGYYTINISERSVYSNITWGDYGSIAGAGFFFDNTEGPQQTTSQTPTPLSGTTRPVLRDVSLTDATTTNCPGCYGVVQEGANINIAFGPSNACGGGLPIAWVTSVGTMGSTKGEITGITVGYESSQCGTNYGNPALTCTIYGGPLNFPWSSTSDARVSTSNSTPNLQFSNTGALTGFNTPLSSDTGTTFSANLSSGGMTLDGVNIFTSLPTGLAQIQEGLWMEGIANPLIGHLHCTNTNRYCEHYAYGQPLDGGVFYNHDSLQGASAGLIDLGYGIDNNQSLISFSALNGNIIYDQKNKFTLTSSSAVTKVGQYFPQGLALYTHLNNPPLPSGTSDNVGKCTLAPVSNPPTCFVGFSVPWNSPPVCTASNQTNTAAVKVIANTSGVTLVGATAGDVVAFQCEGNPN